MIPYWYSLLAIGIPDWLGFGPAGPGGRPLGRGCPRGLSTGGGMSTGSQKEINHRA